MDRRAFLMTGVGLAGAVLSHGSAVAGFQRGQIKAIAFDGFPIFDPRPIAALCGTFFPEKGDELFNLWRGRLFEYTWLRTITNNYADFAQVSEESLDFAIKALKLNLSSEQRTQLLKANFTMKAWPDVPVALKKLKEAGMRLGFLTNLTPAMIQGGIAASGLDGMFEHMISTDMARTYKPDVRAYQLGLDVFKLKREEILFVAFAGWDAAGAKSFGYPTFWANRMRLPQEEIGAAAPDGQGANLMDLVAFMA